MALFFCFYFFLTLFIVTCRLTGCSRFSCSAACEMLVPQPGTEPMSPALQDGFFTTGQPGKPLLFFSFQALRCSFGAHISACPHPQPHPSIWLWPLSAPSRKFLCSRALRYHPPSDHSWQLCQRLSSTHSAQRAHLWNVLLFTFATTKLIVCVFC